MDRFVCKKNYIVYYRDGEMTIFNEGKSYLGNFSEYPTNQYFITTAPTDTHYYHLVTAESGPWEDKQEGYIPIFCLNEWEYENHFHTVSEYREIEIEKILTGVS
tara:strand:- start:60 stop:371 length:312 start_codon:yes stop_codon:yes gene_type:complete